jgi:uncharacterized membrane protein
MLAIIKKLKERNRLWSLVIFALTTTICVAMVAFRIRYASNVTFVFLVWNIFLALIPYGISTLLVLYHEQIKSKWLLVLPFVVWLSFFPNAPYILTDLFHLRQRPEAPFWYDLALILFFAWNGLMLGYASLIDMQHVISERFNNFIGWIVAIGSLILGSFGIYLGRYLRWNSWDVLSSPTGLFKDISDRVLNPMDHPQTYGVTIIFSVFLVVGYLLLVQISSHRVLVPKSK